jgi:hypothetical protein
MLCPWAESSGRLLCILLAPTQGAINRALTRVLPDREIGRQSKGGKAGGGRPAAAWHIYLQLGSLGGSRPPVVVPRAT